MKFCIYTFTFPSGQKAYYKANLVEATAHIFQRTDPKGEWFSTQYITADTGHTIEGLKNLVLRIEEESDETHELDDVETDDISVTEEVEA